MNKILNKSIREIDSFSKQEKGEYQDLLPEGIFESIDFFKKLEKEQTEYITYLYSNNISRTPFLPFDDGKHTWFAMPKTKKAVCYFGAPAFSKIFKFNLSECKQHHLPILKSFMCFLFDIKEEEIKLTLKESQFSSQPHFPPVFIEIEII